MVCHRCFAPVLSTCYCYTGHAVVVEQQPHPEGDILVRPEGTVLALPLKVAKKMRKQGVELRRVHLHLDS